MVEQESSSVGVSAGWWQGKGAESAGNRAILAGAWKLSRVCSASHVTQWKNASIIFSGQQSQVFDAVPESLWSKGEDA
jgi:hypothetical protein